MLPPTLFHYCAATQRTLENIKRQCLYFGGVETFNDPFECQLTPAHANGDPAIIESMRERYTVLQSIPIQIREQINGMGDASFAAMIKRAAVDSIAQAKRNFIERCGVVCLSERNENLLMWSHYSSSGSGVCLEFRTQFEIFSKAVRVIYQDEPPFIDALNAMDSAFSEKTPSWIQEMYCTKPSDWAYEKEWRVIHSKKGTAYIFPKDCLKAVYFGPKCSTAFIEIVCLILLGQNPKVEFWRGKISERKYAVEFEHFTYTSFVRASPPTASEPPA